MPCASHRRWSATSIFLPTCFASSLFHPSLTMQLWDECGRSAQESACSSLRCSSPRLCSTNAHAIAECLYKVATALRALLTVQSCPTRPSSRHGQEVLAPAVAPGELRLCFVLDLWDSSAPTPNKWRTPELHMSYTQDSVHSGKLET